MERLTRRELWWGNKGKTEKAVNYKVDEERRCVTHEGSVDFLIADRLAEYEDLEGQGKLLELPCAVGDTVYRINKGAKEPIVPMKVCEVGAVSLKVGGFVMQIMCRDGVGNGETYYLGVDFGKAVFSTEQEAEAALKGVWTPNRP